MGQHDYSHGRRHGGEQHDQSRRYNEDDDNSSPFSSGPSRMGGRSGDAQSGRSSGARGAGDWRGGGDDWRSGSGGRWAEPDDGMGSRDDGERRRWSQSSAGGYGGMPGGHEGGGYGGMSAGQGGQYGGRGMGSPSSSAGGGYGSRQRGSDDNQFDPDYHQWRSEQMRNLDDDYRSWRQDRYKKFSEEFSNWRTARQKEGNTGSQDAQPGHSVQTGPGGTPKAGDSATQGNAITDQSQNEAIAKRSK